MDYSSHPDAAKLHPAKASEYIPAWQTDGGATEPEYTPPKLKSKPANKKTQNRHAVPPPPGEKPGIVRSDKESIMSNISQQKIDGF
jgi:hypothetical protein